jgi:glycosyltransferase involved in cell wall biosynthesis
MVWPKGAAARGGAWAGMAGVENVGFIAIEAGMGISPYTSAEQYTQQVSMRQPAVTHQEREALAKALGPEFASAAATPAPLAALAGTGSHYGGDLFSEIERYAKMAVLIAAQEQFDVIHAHDWMTYRAGVAVSAISGKPLVVHVHSTEFDRSGEHVNQTIYDIERMGMHFATRVIAVSHLTKNIVVARYAVPAEKVEVVYNAIDLTATARRCRRRSAAKRSSCCSSDASPCRRGRSTSWPPRRRF